MTQEMMIGNRIEALLRSNKVKYGTLAVIIDRCPQTVSKRMLHPETYTVEELIKIAKHFKIQLKDLTGGAA